ncbi:MAG: hypothetical protein ACI4TP_07575, partial [Anaerotignum sp.]
MDISIVITALKAIGILSLVFFLNNFRWLLIALRLRKKYVDNKNDPMKNIKIENEVTALFNKSGVNMIDRRSFVQVS